jgi:hypothetical protein
MARKRRNYDAPSEQPDALAARQREHRLKERVKPAQPADWRTDPWQLCAEALDAIDRLRTKRSVGYSFASVDEDLDTIEERVKRLAWGPED